MITAKRHLGLKLIALALVVTIFATLLPQRMVFWAEESEISQTVLPIAGSDFSQGDLLEEQTDKQQIDALFEDTSLRTSNSKTLRLNDGTYTLGSYDFNIHFQTSEGFVEYNNTLLRKGDSYSPAVSDIALSFAFDRPSYAIGFDGIKASFELINDNIRPVEAQIAELPKQEYSNKSAELFACGCTVKRNVVEYSHYAVFTKELDECTSLFKVLTL